MSVTAFTANEMLEKVYNELDYHSGSLILLSKTDFDISEWIEKGEWIDLAKKIGAESIFFVNNDPVIIFYQSDTYSEEILTQIFLKAWSMARPQCLFIALEGEILVYGLNQLPQKNENNEFKISPIKIVQNVADIAERLKDFNRVQIETGNAFAEELFGKVGERADKQLIKDLRNVRKNLIGLELPIRYTHSLIGRSIFIRYLEDREILNYEYFQEIAKKSNEWLSLLSISSEKNLIIKSKHSFYQNILQNKDFTYELFAKLAEDFNGNLFATNIEEEKKIVTPEHLNLLRRFLLGDTNENQEPLFFWAYDFSIIPIDLISSIYEEFYHLNQKDNQGTHYTPSVLVEYLLSNILTENILSTHPVIVDPACGSGIFLVEAFRRIVRFRTKLNNGQSLTASELRGILHTQIRGIDVNTEAIHIAAFSLYLALMHYLTPPAIQKNPLLPKLIWEEPNDNNLNILFNNNIFDLTESELIQITDKLSQKTTKKFESQCKLLIERNRRLPLPLNSCDIVIGNPPWGFINKKAPLEVKNEQEQAKSWCHVFGWSIGDNELSQAFIARSLTLLKSRGQAALLVSSGIFFKHGIASVKFRQRWLTETTIHRVVNFSHLRHLYFSASSPFAFVKFQFIPPHSSHRIQYWVAKNTRRLNNTQAVVLSYTDLHRVNQVSLLNDEVLWKVYWWGGHQDADFISTLRLEKKLFQLAKERDWEYGQGFKGEVKFDANRDSDWLKEYGELEISDFSRYGILTSNNLKKVPGIVHQLGKKIFYEGSRLLIKRGITEANKTYGRIEARLETLSYCFRNSIHAIKLNNTEDWEKKILIGILWSSFARYYYFMISSTWGFWHHEIHLSEIMSLPIRFPTDKNLKNNIITIVEQLQNVYLETLHSKVTSKAKIKELENSLDEAIFTLFELNRREKSLILDMCNYDLKFFYDSTIEDFYIIEYPNYNTGIFVKEWLDEAPQNELKAYIATFLNIWNLQLEPDGEFRWRLIAPDNIPMIAVVFTTQNKGELATRLSISDEQEWLQILDKLDRVLQREVSRSIYIDGIVRVVTDTDIIIIKRKEKRLWTRTRAYEDAQATLLQAINLQTG